MEAVSDNLREMVLVRATLEPGIVTSLTALRGLYSLEMLEHSYKTNVSSLDEHTESFPQAIQLKSLSMPLQFWFLFPQDHFKSLRVLNLDGQYFKGSIPRNPLFPMALRSVSVNFALDIAILEALGNVPYLEYLEMNLPQCNRQPGQPFSYVGVYSAQTFLHLRELTLHQYYLDYMQKFDLPKLKHFSFSNLVRISNPEGSQDSDLEASEIPEIRWCHQLLSLAVTCKGEPAWNSQAAFSKLELLLLNFVKFAAPVRCQFPALRKLKVLHGDICDYLECTPPRFPKLQSLEVEGFIGNPVRFPFKCFSSPAISHDVLNSVMKSTDLDQAHFLFLCALRWKPVELYWHNTSSSIQLWKLIPTIKFGKAETTRLKIL
jgi:hypothetical protein